MIGDRHLHTCFSVDSSESVDEVIKTAILLGMKEICITDHCDFDLGAEWILSSEEYIAAMRGFKEKYEGRINVHIGVELGLNPEFNAQISEYAAAAPFEYIIGSIHTMQGDDPYYRDRYDMDDRTFYRIYFETALERLQKCSLDIDVFGHFDYIVRYGYEKAGSYDPAEYADLIDPILKELISRGIALELNTAGIRKSGGFIHPHSYILQRYKDLGGKKISIGSDAHFARDIGASFDAAEQVMKKFGFSESDLAPYRMVGK